MTWWAWLITVVVAVGLVGAVALGVFGARQYLKTKKVIDEAWDRDWGSSRRRGGNRWN